MQGICDIERGFRNEVEILLLVSESQFELGISVKEEGLNKKSCNQSTFSDQESGFKYFPVIGVIFSWVPVPTTARGKFCYTGYRRTH